MLYVTTQSEEGNYTAQFTLQQAVAEDGGLFIPMVLPRYADRELAELMKLPYWERVSRVLSRFFPVSLDGWFLSRILPEPQIQEVGHKSAVASLWEPVSGSYEAVVEILCRQMDCQLTEPWAWPSVAIGVAVLFGLYGALCQKGWIHPGQSLSLAMGAGEFTLPMATWYAGRMGLPLGSVVCVCNENSRLWDLFHRGEVRLDDTVIHTELPLFDVAMPRNLRRLIVHTLGREALAQYDLAESRRRSFFLSEEETAHLRQGFYISVAGAARAQPLASGLYETEHCLLSPYTALVYGGLMDYRSLGGESAPTLILGEQSPKGL